MKKSKSKRRIWMFLITFFLILCVYIPIEILVHFHQYKEKGTYIFRDYFLISANDTYVGTIDMDNSKVRITAHSGTEVSCVDTSDTEEGRPDQIALGDTSYYLLYQGMVGERDSRIVQYDYQSGKIKECTMRDIATIACHDGCLFLGEWQYEEDIEDRYFSTEPVIEDYGEISGGFFRADERKDHYQAETKQEEKNRSMLLRKIGADKSKQDLRYEVCEYQEGELIFGICNVYKHWNHHRTIKQQDVANAYFYRIDPSKEEITILGQARSCIGIAVSEAVVVYQKDDKIIQENVESGEKKIIYNIKNICDLNIYVNGDYLLVAEWEKKLFSEKRNCYPVEWNNADL